MKLERPSERMLESNKLSLHSKWIMKLSKQYLIFSEIFQLIQLMNHRIDSQIGNSMAFHRKLFDSKLSLGLVGACNQVKRRDACSGFVLSLSQTIKVCHPYLLSGSCLASKHDLGSDCLIFWFQVCLFHSWLKSNSLLNILPPLGLVWETCTEFSHYWNENSVLFWTLKIMHITGYLSVRILGTAAFDRLCVDVSEHV